MKRRNLPSTWLSTWKGLALSLLALAGGLRPAWGAVLPDGRPAAEVDRMSCCFASEEGGCRPVEERQPGPDYRPPCCGFDAPARPAERVPAPSATVQDPTERVLREHAGCLSCELACELLWEPAGWSEDGLHAPPRTAVGLAAGAIHWLTERELIAALALLSIARL